MLPEENVQELERLLSKISAALKRVLPYVTARGFPDSDVREAVLEAESLSRWKRTPLPDGKAGYDIAVAQAKKKAADNGEPFVVAREERGSLVVVSKARLLRDMPFGITENCIIYDTTDPA